jgi:ATP-dependent Clp protease adapter protein ClpS
MSSEAVYDAGRDMYQAHEDGQPVCGTGSEPLRYETAEDAQDMLDRRAELAAIPPRPLGPCR